MQTIVSLPLQPWPYCLICLHVRCFVSFARSPVFSRWWQFVVQFIAVTLVKLKILLTNFKIMPSLFSSISFLRLNPKNVVFSPQINVLPLYTAKLGFRHSHCTQTYNVQLQTHWCRHNSVWLCSAEVWLFVARRVWPHRLNTAAYRLHVRRHQLHCGQERVRR